MSKRKVLFLCTGNSARSQMAEAWVNHLLGERWEAASAGTRPSGQIHPLAIRVMQEVGLDISARHSKSTEEFRNVAFDLVVTVCDNAARDCPAWLGKGRQVHLGFPDPAAADGGEQARTQIFRQVRDEIRDKVIGYVAAWEPTSGSQEFRLN